MQFNGKNIFSFQTTRHFKPNFTEQMLSDEEDNPIHLNNNETKELHNNTSNHTTPYEVPVEIVVLLSVFYGAISLVAVLGKC